MKRISTILALLLAGTTGLFAQHSWVCPDAEDASKPGTTVISGTTFISIYDLLSRIPSINVYGDGTVTIAGEEDGFDSEALIVVDGIEQFGGLETISPNDVYSVDVKRSTETAIYGIKGAHGAIEITTKGQHFMDVQDQIAAERERPHRILQDKEAVAKAKANVKRNIAKAKARAAEIAKAALDKAREFKEKVVGTVQEKAAEIRAKRAKENADKAEEAAKEADKDAKQAEKEADEASLELERFEGTAL